MTLALTVHEPWASLLVDGYKRFEFRSWRFPAGYVGETIAIHAGKTFDRDAISQLLYWHQTATMEANGLTADAAENAILHADEATFGIVIGEVVFGRSITGHALAEDLGRGGPPPDNWGWPVLRAQRYARPFPARGRQGIWRLEDRLPPMEASDAEAS